MEKIKRKIESLYTLKLPDNLKVNNDRLSNLGLRDITLRPYQEDGVNWLIERYHRGHGCILGDEMGLGKTCQTISFLTYLFGTKESQGPFLILSPLSVLANWQNELARFAPQLTVISYVGDKDSRSNIRHELRHSSDRFHVLLTTYEICLKDENFLQKISWEVLVVDEAHRLKNQESLLYQALSEFNIGHCILLTGTPVQNNLRELYALLSFVAHKLFRHRHLEEFVEKYSDAEQDTPEVQELHGLLKPFLLRRLKAEVVTDLPNKSEIVLYHGISSLQKKYYKAILTKDIEAFENPNQTSRTRLNNILMQLRKCVNHPYLFDGVEPEPFQLGEHLVEASGKLTLIDQLLAYLKVKGHKVLMFSQMTHMLDIIQDYLGYRGYTYERLDGSVRGEERYLAVQNFNEDDDTFIFLLSTKAGGQGLNLVAADTVIFVDSDFNPQNDLQAAARAHRIGQTRPVKVVRLIGRSTVEEIVLRRAEAKLKLTTTVIEGGQFSLGASKESLIEDNNMKLQDILKFGVDKLFETEDSTIEEANLEAILGPSVDGQWQPEESSANEAKASQVAASVEEPMEEGEGTEQTLYMFEGTDYSKEPSKADQKAFDDLLAAEKALLEESSAEGRALRKTKTYTVAMLLPELPRKQRKQLTPEEKEERKKKRAEAAARRAKEEEEEEVRRAQERRKKREELWSANGYSSTNISLDSEGESDEDENQDGGDAVDVEDVTELSDRKAIKYVSGDVTHPSNTGSADAIIVHCVDDSGRWGQGGVFSAISARSLQPEQNYTMAGRMKDLALGDAHLVSVDDLQSRSEGRDFLALIVAQHRDRKNNLSGIKLSALSQGLERVYRAANQKKASVHLPRIGYNTPGFNWYGTERLIRKHLASKGIPTYIYYYPRRHHGMKRKGSSHSGSSKKERRHSRDRDRDDDHGRGSKSPHLPNFMEGIHVYFHGLTSDEEKKLRRYLTAYDGNVHTELEELTTHVVARLENSQEKRELNEKIAENMAQGVHIVTVDWLKDSYMKGKKMSTEPYSIDMDTETKDSDSGGD